MIIGGFVLDGRRRLHVHLCTSLLAGDAQIAQLVEQRIENPRVDSSTLSLGTILSMVLFWPEACVADDDARAFCRNVGYSSWRHEAYAR